MSEQRVHRVLSKPQFVTSIVKHPQGSRTFTRTHGGVEMASMSLEPTAGREDEGYHDAPPGSRAVEGIEVHPDYQGQGHATDMWHMAQKLGLNPVHSVDRTLAGDTWARKMGGHLPPLPTSESTGYPLYAEHYGEWNQ